MPPPSAVLIDIGDTLLEEQRFDLEAGIHAVVANDGDAAALAAAFRMEVMERHRTHREPLLAQWLRERVPALARRTIPDIEDCVWPAVVSLSPRLGVSAVLDRLVADGIPLCAVSNAAFSGRVLRGELDRHGLADSFQFVVSSADLDSRKPAPLIFTTAIAQLGVAASTAWFVGDTVSEDIVGAARAGLLPIWFCNTPSRDAPHANVPVLYAWADFVALYEASIVAQQRV